MTTRRLAGDRGSTAVEFPLAVGLILLPVAVLVMVIPQWPERQTVATAAAKQAATLYATGDTSSAGAAAASAAVQQAAANYGLPGLRLELSGDWCRGCTVTAKVTVDIPAVQVPTIGTIGGVRWTAASSARVEDYASRSTP
ncbi:MAG: hypothetical protein QM733_04625 [Ilumatobacteraceae bacterium]